MNDAQPTPPAVTPAEPPPVPDRLAGDAVIWHRVPRAVPPSRFLLRFGLALAGAMVLFVGVFLPLLNMPFRARLNYFDNGAGDGLIVMALAAVSALLAARGRFRWLWATGLGVFAMLGFLILHLQQQLEQARMVIEQQYGGTPMAEMAGMAVASVQIQWGFAVMAAGAMLLLASAAVPPARR